MASLHLLFTFLIPFSALVHGHGNMVRPYAWWDANKIGWYFLENQDESLVGCGTLNLPPTEFEVVNNGRAPDCAKMWFRKTTLPEGQEPSIPEEISQPEVKCIGQAGENDQDLINTYPWAAPGRAPVYPCGNLGGAPTGCDEDGVGSFGDCCGDVCGRFAMGDMAENYEWPSMPITEWNSGSYQEVAWYVSANHAGGYSYRLCKIPEEGISGLTEECFQQTPLEFAGDVQWVEYNKDRGNPGTRTKITANQTTVGTYPEGSMWRANPLYPKDEEGGSSGLGKGHVIDQVEIPADIDPGFYALSFRLVPQSLSQIIPEMI